ncbi:MAG TPA: threonine--tRNA ligase [Candidatus Caccosoma faecigallinarum]|uniref:Threonine--tRNA ligase n=1 Tax=Candidatus Caccosoma faecigallinarum TaxID=2840720 RepID=A0A9D1G948_9FIRM|nr:threonine--tRNA ligase [Candidatus Caccosoma faecigallinarum]
MVNIKEDERLSVLNHSCAHLLAQAVKHLYPQAKFWVGPVIEDGFYYDMDLQDQVIKEEDLPAIEKEMKKIAKDGKRIVKEELTRQQALDLFADDPYKIDLIEHFNENEIITAYRQGDFVDLCRGPHIESVKLLKHFKLLKVSGAYYKGDSNNKMLQRIYGICFENEQDLQDYLNFLEEAKKRDHRKLGKELELFMLSEYGPGFPFWLPDGMILRRQLENFWIEEHLKEGYQLIQTPIMLNKKLWEISGHWANYRENMYTSEIDKYEFAIKPMNCPGSLLVYKNSIHSYKDFPLKLGELGLVHRHEASGALNGLFRVRTFTQDDAHLFMSENMIQKEVKKLIAFYDRIYSVFGLDYHIELSTRPENKYIGKISTWNRAEKALAKACEASKKPFKINPGDGAFYGPKLDFKLRDSLGRIWQCGTIQLDMNLPERFDITYVDKDGTKKRPIMLHRALLGSIERFIGIIIEHYAGAFPLWLAPKQVVVLPVNNEYHRHYAHQIVQALKKHGIRAHIDDRDEKLGYRIREANLKKITYQVVVGDEEIQNKTLKVRHYGKQEQTSMTFKEFLKKLQVEIKNKA